MNMIAMVSTTKVCLRTRSSRNPSGTEITAAVIERDRDFVTDVMMAVAGRMSGEPLGEEARPFVEAMAAEEDRLVIRCRPYATFAQPPRHLHHNDQEEKLTHWASATVPWDAPDPA
jgi:hypothetical protein